MDPLALLPRPLALHIFELLPLDDRLICLQVNRAWRAALAERSLWSCLDVTPHTAHRALCDDRMLLLLRAAASRAHGALRSLRISHARGEWWPHVVQAVRDSANSVEVLHLENGPPAFNSALSLEHCQELLRAASRLRITSAVAARSAAEACALLRLSGLRPSHLALCKGGSDDEDDALLALAAAVRSAPPLGRLSVGGYALDAPGVLDALAEAALFVKLGDCSLSGFVRSPARLPALCRLLRGGTLHSLALRGVPGYTGHLLDAPGAALLADAIRAATSLRHLSLIDLGIDFQDAPCCAAVYNALAGHRSLRALRLGEWYVDPEAYGVALGALVAAGASALEELSPSVGAVMVDEAALRPLFDALPGNARLRELHCGGVHFSDGFVRDVMLPAVASSPSLRVLTVASRAAEPAEQLVRRRSEGGAAC